MIETAQQVIEALAAERGDFRIHIFEIYPLFDVEAEGSSGRLVLDGKVLEQADLDFLLNGLRAALPGLPLDATGVRVLRQAGNPLRAVATNLTSLHREPSFLAEQLSQLHNGMQVEILLEEERWAYVRQLDGYLGWTYLPYLTGLPVPSTTHLAMSPVEQLLAEPLDGAAILTRVLGGTHLRRISTRGDWAEVELTGGLVGWLPDHSLRPLDQLPANAAERRAQMVADGVHMIGTPYLWGGNSANGIDCSGLAQLVHRWVGIDLPRDADMQCRAGRPIQPPFHPGDLLFFGDRGVQGAPDKVTHVAISLGGWQILHSSRSRNGVYPDDVQAVPGLRDSFLCGATFQEE